MKIQWFPGHMTKALRLIDDNIKLVDAAIYILDARAPYSSLNPELEKRFSNKPFLYILNKSDLADESATKAWLEFYKNNGAFAIPCDSRNSVSASFAYKNALKLMATKIEKYQAKDMNRSMRFMVIGIPNSGKSTFINNLCGQKRANTGDKPGVTKGKQWISVDGKIELLDTPGTTYPDFKNQEIARNLAYIGSINDDILDVSDLAFELVKFLSVRYPTALSTRYNIELSDDPLNILENVCKIRGFLMRKNEFDYDRCGKAIIDDYRKGRLGKITLELPDDFYVKKL